VGFQRNGQSIVLTN